MPSTIKLYSDEFVQMALKHVYEHIAFLEKESKMDIDIDAIRGKFISLEAEFNEKLNNVVTSCNTTIQQLKDRVTYLEGVLGVKR